MTNIGGFSLPVEVRGLSIPLVEDSANKYKGSFRICKPLQNQNAVDAEFNKEKNPSENAKCITKTGSSENDGF